MDYSDITNLGIGTTQLMSGWQESISVPSPAAGVSTVTRQIPADTWERVVLAKVTLTTGTTAGNRFGHYYIADGKGVIVGGAAFSGTVVASSALTAYGTTGAQDNLSASGFGTFRFPDIVLPSGWQVYFEVDGMTATDQLSDCNFVIQRYPSDVASGDEYQERLQLWRKFYRSLKSGQSAGTAG